MYKKQNKNSPPPQKGWFRSQLGATLKLDKVRLGSRKSAFELLTKNCYVMVQAWRQSQLLCTRYTIQEKQLLHVYFMTDRYMVELWYIYVIWQCNFFIYYPKLPLLHTLPYNKGPDCGYGGNHRLQPQYMRSRGQEESIDTLFLVSSNVELFRKFTLTC